MVWRCNKCGLELKPEDKMPTKMLERLLKDSRCPKDIKRAFKYGMVCPECGRKLRIIGIYLCSNCEAICLEGAEHIEAF
jgi:predicted amidophosphoribosyltransferase